MKKIICLFIFGLLVCFQLQAKKYPVLSVTKSGKGHGTGYDYVHWELLQAYVPGQSNVTGWVGNCQNPGSVSCGGPPQGYVGFDQTDLNIAHTLLGHADGQIANGTFNGSYSQNVQVTGEQFLRVYTVRWQSSGSTITQSVERDDVY